MCSASQLLGWCLSGGGQCVNDLVCAQGSPPSAEDLSEVQEGPTPKPRPACRFGDRCNRRNLRHWIEDLPMSTCTNKGHKCWGQKRWRLESCEACSPWPRVKGSGVVQDWLTSLSHLLGLLFNLGPLVSKFLLSPTCSVISCCCCCVSVCFSLCSLFTFKVLFLLCLFVFGDLLALVASMLWSQVRAWKAQKDKQNHINVKRVSAKTGRLNRISLPVVRTPENYCRLSVLQT